MNRKIFSIFVVLALVTAFVPMTADAAPPDNPVMEALFEGADYHLANQGTWTHGFTGNPVPDSWEWIVGNGFTFPNVDYGVSGMGLVAAGERIHPRPRNNNLYLGHASVAASHLRTRYNATTDRPFAQDVEFLDYLGRARAQLIFELSAAEYYARVIRDFPDPNDNVDRHVAPRRSLMGWDLSSHIRAAWFTDNFAYAEGMYDRLVERRDDWEGVPCCGGFDATLLSYGSLLWAIGETGIGASDPFRQEMINALLISQAPDGSWGPGDHQTTAYAVLGLSVSPRGGGVREAVEDALGYIVNAQNGNGGWDFGGIEFGEVNSEVLMALGTPRGFRVGNASATLGFRSWSTSTTRSAPILPADPN